MGEKDGLRRLLAARAFDVQAPHVAAGIEGDDLALCRHGSALDFREGALGPGGAEKGVLAELFAASGVEHQIPHAPVLECPGIVPGGGDVP